MALAIVAALVFGLLLLVAFENMEISIAKYGIINAISAQSEAVDKALRDLLSTKTSPTILNKEYRKLEKIYIGSLNLYLLQRLDLDILKVRKEILTKRGIQF